MQLRLASLVATVAVVGGSGGLALARPFPAAWLPRRGEGYLVPDTWAARGLRYGRPELVGLLERAAQRVARGDPGATLYIGDLSLKSGRATQWHRSHKRGIDADLLFFAQDEDGEPAPPPAEMVHFDARGLGVLPDGALLRFDVARNWALVRALLTDPRTQVVRIFVSDPLRARLLAYALHSGAPGALIARAADVLAQPGDSAPHDDHFHVRIAGPPGYQAPARARHARSAKLARRHHAGRVVRHRKHTTRRARGRIAKKKAAKRRRGRG